MNTMMPITSGETAGAWVFDGDEEEFVGALVGDSGAVGEGVGDAVGDGVGDGVGDAVVGDGVVGEGVGETVGDGVGAGVVGEGVGATQQMGQYVLSGSGPDSGHAGQHTHLSQGAAQPQLELMHFVAQLELAAHRGLDAFQT